MKCRLPNAFLLVMGSGASKGAGRAAARALGTRTKKGTVNTVLREVLEDKRNYRRLPRRSS